MPDTELLFGPTPHHEAIDFIKSKPVMSRDVFNGLLPELKARAFCISGVEGANVLQAVRDRIADLPAGHLWNDVKKDIAADISPFIVDPDASPEERDGQVNAANRRAELLMRTHGFQAYQAANYQVMDRQRDVLPYWQYLTMEDERVRPTHAALDQVVLPQDSPFWQGHFPPWDWGCRCQVVPISQEDRDDLAQDDKKRPSDDKRVLEGPIATHLEQGTLVRAGRTYDVRPPVRKSDNAFSWDPGSLRMSIDQLRARYDAPTFAAFEAWAKQTPLKMGGAKTVWAWLGGAPAGTTPQPVAGTADTATVPALLLLLQRMHVQHEAISAEMKKNYDQYRLEIAALQVDYPKPGSPEMQEVIRKNNEINARFTAERNALVAKRELVIAQERQFVRQPAGAASKLPVAIHSAAGLLKYLQEGLDLWRGYAAAGVDVAAPLSVFALPRSARAFCDSVGIHLAPGDTASTVMHEIAHWVDRCHPLIAKANIKFLDRRTVGETPQRLSKLTGIKAYGPGEVAKPDKFHNAYVGKVYRGTASEIMSMGIERLHKNPGLFAREDPDYCGHVLRMLRGEVNP